MKRQAKVVTIKTAKKQESKNDPFEGFSKVERIEPKDDTPTMNNRIMPRKDFERVIEHDKIYLSALHQELEYNLIKQNILAEKCEKVLANQTREKIITNIEDLCEWARVKRYCLDIKAMLVAQERLVSDKENHFNHVFLPQHLKEMAECKANFKEVFENSVKLINEAPVGSEDIVSKLKYEFAWWNKLSKEDQKEEERQLQLFMPIRRLYNAWLRVVNG